MQTSMIFTSFINKNTIVLQDFHTSKKISPPQRMGILILPKLKSAVSVNNFSVCKQYL